MHLDIGDRPSISQARGRLRRARGADGDEGASTQCHRRRMQIVRDDGGHGVATAAPVVSLRKGAPVRGVGGGDGQAPGLEGLLRPEK